MPLNTLTTPVAAAAAAQEEETMLENTIECPRMGLTLSTEEYTKDLLGVLDAFEQIKTIYQHYNCEQVAMNRDYVCPVSVIRNFTSRTANYVGNKAISEALTAWFDYAELYTNTVVSTYVMRHKVLGAVDETLHNEEQLELLHHFELPQHIFYLTGQLEWHAELGIIKVCNHAKFYNHTDMKLLLVDQYTQALSRSDAPESQVVFDYTEELMQSDIPEAFLFKALQLAVHEHKHLKAFSMLHRAVNKGLRISAEDFNATVKYMEDNLSQSETTLTSHQETLLNLVRKELRTCHSELGEMDVANDAGEAHPAMLRN